MAEPRVDLTDERAQALGLAGLILDEQVGPWIEDQLHETWPRRTGTSARAWNYASGNLTNNVDYAEHIRTRDGLAVDSVLQPIVTEAASRRWVE